MGRTKHRRRQSSSYDLSSESSLSLDLSESSSSSNSAFKRFEKSKKCGEKKCKRSKRKERNPCLTDENVRSYDGRNNNLDHPEWGSVGQELLRKGESQYSGNGTSDMSIRGPKNPNPRYCSNTSCYSDVPHPDKKGLTNMFWVYGQFIDHTITLTPEGNEEADMETPEDDPVLPNAIIPFKRSVFSYSSGTSPQNPRQQVNVLPSYVDAGNVYGFDFYRAGVLRANDGTGKLLTSQNDKGDVLLPFNTFGLPNAGLPGQNPESLYIAGDVRANENVLLLSIHTLFMREHNLVCDELVKENPSWSGNDELIFQMARKIVNGKLQVITYNEFLTYMFGCQITPWKEYNPCIDAGIHNEFSAAAYRLGHSMLSENLKIVNQSNGQGNSQEEEDIELPLKDAFFKPSVVTELGIDGILEGGWKAEMQTLDTIVVEAVRSFLFGSPNVPQNMLLDLAAINMQRGRDHGLPDYNTLRQYYGLRKVRTFEQISSQPGISNSLKEMYGNVNSIDPWLGGLAEDHVGDGLVGPLFQRILQTQFKNLRDGDRFWYENDDVLTDKQKYVISKTKLSDIIRRNTQISNVPTDVFHI